MNNQKAKIQQRNKINYFYKIILFFYLFINTLKCYILYTDLVPFIFYSQQTLKSLNGFNSGVVSVDYSSKNFHSEPVVILGILKYNNQWDPFQTQFIDFQLTSTQVTQKSCKVQVQEGPKNILYGFDVSILIIDTTQFPYIQVIHTEKQNVFYGSNNYIYEETRQFSQQILQINGQKNVLVFLRGFSSKPYNNQNDRFTLSIKVIQNSSEYKIQIKSHTQSQTIVNVYYTIVEYVDYELSDYRLITKQDTQYEQGDQPNNCFQNMLCINSKKQERYMSVNFNVEKIASILSYPSKNYKNFFASINQLDFQTSFHPQDPRIKLTNFQFESPGIIKYDYLIWDEATSFGSTSNALFFYKKVDCTHIEASNLFLCCQLGQFYLEDTKTCQSNEPLGYYCKKQDDFFLCQICMTQCDKCYMDSSRSLHCAQCSLDFYLFDENCLSLQPNNTFCDVNRICSKCNNIECKTCNNPTSNPQQCLSCYINKYLYNGTCFTPPLPDNTYCDNSLNKCFQCNDIACKQCNNPNSSPQLCLSCYSNNYLFKGKCSIQQPNGTFCDGYNCASCIDSKCKTCTDPSTTDSVCLSCYDGDYLYLGKCYPLNNLPDNTYCDSSLYKCYTCQEIECKSCNNPNSNPQLCLSCYSNNYLFKGKCSIQQPNGTFCEGYNCASCIDSKCKTCTDPSTTDSVCLSCYDGDYLYLGKCYSSNNLPDNTYCDSSLHECYTCQDITCKTCTDSRLSNSQCVSCRLQYYLYQKKCYLKSDLPDNIYCDPKFFQCFQCNDQSCKQCSDPRTPNSKCISCRSKEYFINNNTCKKFTIKIKESYEISNSSTYKYLQNFAYVSTALSIVSGKLNFSKQFFSIQKLNLLIIMNVLFTEQLYTFIEAIRGTNLIENLKIINIISKYIFIESEQQLNDQKITQKVGQTSIIINAGGAIVLFFIITILMITLLINKKINQSQFQDNWKEPSILQKIQNYYNIFACNLIYQFNEMIIIIAFIIIFLQIIGLSFHKEQVNLEETKIVIIILVFINQMYVFYYYIMKLNFDFDSSKRLNFRIILQPKISHEIFLQTYIQMLYNLILSENKESSNKCRNFKIYFIIIENVLIPFSIIIFYNQFQIQCYLCIVFQLILCLISIHLKPSQQFIENTGLIVDQVCWTISFIMLLIYGGYVKSLTNDPYQQNQDLLNIVNTLSFTLMVLFIIILYIKPLIQIIKIIQKIILYFNQRKQQSQQQKQENSLLELINSLPKQRLFLQCEDKITNQENIFKQNFYLLNRIKYAFKRKSYNQSRQITKISNQSNIQSSKKSQIQVLDHSSQSLDINQILNEEQKRM